MAHPGDADGTHQQPSVPAVAELRKVVALDGPAGSGKSTVARLVAGRLGWRFVDTGATYRAVTLAALRAGADPSDEAAVLAAATRAHVELSSEADRPGVLLDGEDVSVAIRGPEVTAAVSAVSAHPPVRARLVDLQRAAMGTEGAVVEGRDIATVVAPYALVKVYLDARPEVRARRRAGDVHVGIDVARVSDEELASVIARDLVRRDALDNQTNRLQASTGAVHLDTSDLTLDQVVSLIVELTHDALRVDEGRDEGVDEDQHAEEQEQSAADRPDSSS